jgi:hypothetical protein
MKFRILTGWIVACGLTHVKKIQEAIKAVTGDERRVAGNVYSGGGPSDNKGMATGQTQNLSLPEGLQTEIEKVALDTGFGFRSCNLKGHGRLPVKKVSKSTLPRRK